MIEKFKFYSNKVLPLVYEDSLSYYEVVSKVVVKLNEIVESQNLVTEGFGELQGEVGRLLLEFNDLEEGVATFKAEVLQAFEDFKGEVDVKVAEVAEAIVTQKIDEMLASPEFAQLVQEKADVAVANKMVSVAELQVLGWTVPDAMPVKNTLVDGVLTQNVGRLDLDSLNWSSVNTSNDASVNVSSIMKYPTSTSVKANIYTSSYVTVERANIHTLPKEVCINATGALIVHDTSFASGMTGAEVKTALSGTYLYYELETPIQRNVTNDVGLVRNTTNLLNPTLQSMASVGITVTNNNDGTYTFNGTASANFASVNFEADIFLKRGKYKYFGCPKGGSLPTFTLRINPMSGSAPSGWSADTGDGVILDVPQDMYVRVYPIILSGTVCNNLLFKPMITTDLNATYDDFVPYTGDTGYVVGDIAEIKKGWELIGSVTGNNDVSIDSTQYKEFLVVQTYTNSRFVHHVVSKDLTASVVAYIGGYYVNASVNTGVSISTTTTKITNSEFYYNGTNSISSTTMVVYGKR